MPTTTQQFNRGIDQTAEQAKTLTDKISDTACDVAATVKDKVEAAKSSAADLVDKAKDTACQARDQAKEMVSCAAAKAQDIGQDATRMMRQYPMQALLVSFGVGLLFAQLIRRS